MDLANDDFKKLAKIVRNNIPEEHKGKKITTLSRPIADSVEIAREGMMGKSLGFVSMIDGEIELEPVREDAKILFENLENTLKQQGYKTRIREIV